MDPALTSTPMSLRDLPRRHLLTGAGLGIASLAAAPLLAAAAPVAAHRDRHDRDRKKDGAERLSQAMRTLWEDHITWTAPRHRQPHRQLCPTSAQPPSACSRISATSVTPSRPSTALLPATRLAGLLRDIEGAATLLTAAKAGDADAVAAAKAAWYANADAIATALHTLNPRHWPLAEMTAMMREHLDLTLTEATARLTGDLAR